MTEILNPIESRDYQSLLAGYSEATIFHTAAWAKVLQETYGFKPMYLSDRTSLLPLMETKGLGRTRGVALPFTDECPPLIGSNTAAKELWESLVKIGLQAHWRYVEIRGGKQWWPGAQSSVGFWGHSLELRKGDLLGGCEGSVRRAIRKAEESGLSVERREDLAGVKVFYDLHCKTRKKHGLPPQPWRFFSNIHRHILSKGLGLLLVAIHEQKPVASALFLHWGKQAVYKFGASEQQEQHLRGNNLVMWQAINFYAKSGFERLHFGRTSRRNEGLRRFKLGWGTSEHEIDYVKYDLRSGRFVVDKDRAEGWHNEIFSKMPMFLLRIAGAVLYRHWA